MELPLLAWLKLFCAFSVLHAFKNYFNMIGAIESEFFVFSSALLMELVLSGQ